MSVLAHGGGVLAAARRYGIPPDDWLDLSTGINPRGYRLPRVPPAVWQRLPQDEDGLIDIAAGYYGCATLLPVAGSQAAIRMLPRLRPPGRVALLAPMYAEHAQAWRHAGHAVRELPADALLDTREADVVVLANPNNPTGACWAPQALLALYDQLPRDAWLVVDEAFVDATPHISLAGHCPRPGLVVLRSLGKFFGLAGARMGFVLAWPQLLERLATELGPWTLGGPARWAAARALADRAWTVNTRRRLARDGERLAHLLASHGLPPAGGSALFAWVQDPHAAALHEALARRGILTRLFETPSSLRFGLPGTPADWRRLDRALADCRAQRR
ncbi:MAG: threonine-phosphate decarboxylase CobD [Pseudomonadota bacterium]